MKLPLRLLPAVLTVASLGCELPDDAIAASPARSAPSSPSDSPAPSLSGAPRAVAPSLSPSPSLSASPSPSAFSPSRSPWPAPPIAAGPCPPEMALAGRTCVDRWEAHLRVAGSDGALTDHPHTARPARGVRYVATSAAGKMPQGYISRVESQAACAAAGKRLCSRSEWMRACRGAGNARYPYGHQGERGRCNTGKPHLLTLEFPSPPGGMKYDEHFNSPILNAKPGFLAASGAHAGCESPRGTFDMNGNLHEWVSDMVDDDFVRRMEEEEFSRQEQPWVAGNGMFLGGFFSTTGEHGPGCHYVTIAHEPTYHDYSTGFRCCKSAGAPAAPPASP